MHTIGGTRRRGIDDVRHQRLEHATIEVGNETKSVKAVVAERAEREVIWATQKERYPGFADYENKTSREIPVVLLHPTD